VAGHQSLRVSIPKKVPHCNTFRVRGSPPPNEVLLMFDRYVNESNLPVAGLTWNFDGAAIFTTNGWVFKDVEIGAGTVSDKGDHHEIAIVLLGQDEYTAFKPKEYRIHARLPGKAAQEVYTIRNSINTDCP
jgi:hypothetical protein